MRDSKMVGRMATDMLLVDVLGLPDRFFSSVLSVPRRSPSDERKVVLRSIFEFPNTSRYNSCIFFFFTSVSDLVKFQFRWVMFDPTWSNSINRFSWLHTENDSHFFSSEPTRGASFRLLTSVLTLNIPRGVLWGPQRVIFLWFCRNYNN